MGRNKIIAAAAAAIAVVYWLSNGDGDTASSDATKARPNGAPMVQITLPETLSANAEFGKRAFDAKCADCHGANAAGQDGVAPPLVHKIYEPSHHGDAAFLLAAKNGVRAHHWRFGSMPAVEGVTDGDVKMIVAYVRELQRANGIN